MVSMSARMPSEPNGRQWDEIKTAIARMGLYRDAAASSAAAGDSRGTAHALELIGDLLQIAGYCLMEVDPSADGAARIKARLEKIIGAGQSKMDRNA